MWWRMILYMLAGLMKRVGATWPASAIIRLLRRYRPEESGLRELMFSVELSVFSEVVPDEGEYSRTLRDFSEYKVETERPDEAEDLRRVVRAELEVIKGVGRFAEGRDIDWPVEFRRWLEVIADDVGMSTTLLGDTLRTDVLAEFVAAVDKRLEQEG